MEFSLDFFDALRRFRARVGGAAPAPTTPTDPAPAGPNGAALPRQIGAAGMALIQHFESCARKRADGRFDAYPDPATGGAPWTIGWGATGADIVPGLIWTRQQCDERFARDVARFAAGVARAIGTAPTTQNQFDALVSFHYNTGAIATATLTRLHRAGRYTDAAAEFGKWVHAGGKRLNGLVRRRAAEAALYQRV